MQHASSFRRTLLLRAALLVSLCVLAPRLARAASASSDPERVEPPALDLTATTRVPLSLGPELGLELPGRVLLQAHLGWMPELYSRTLSGALQGAGAYDAATAAVIDTTLDSVASLRLAAGWRPFAASGLELLGGYTRITLAGATNTSEVLPLLSREAAARVRAEVGVLDLRLSSSIHAFSVGLGWRWMFAGQIVVRASLEYLQAFSSDSSLQIGSDRRLTQLAAPSVQSLLGQYYLQYVKVPLVGLCLGYRFF
jgi:hypothetical protein